MGFAPDFPQKPNVQNEFLMAPSQRRALQAYEVEQNVCEWV